MNTAFFRRTLLLSLVLLRICAGVRAESNHRAMLLEARARPLQDGALLTQERYEPIFCTADSFVAMFTGEQGDEVVSPVYAQLAWNVSEGHVDFALPGGDGSMGYQRIHEMIRRQSFDDIQVGGETLDVELVVLGMPYYYNYAFVFTRRDEGPWQLQNCLYQFQDATIEKNSETAWLVGKGELSSTQEAAFYAQWYNLRTNTIDVSYVTWASQIADIQGHDLFSANTTARPNFSAYTYDDDEGRSIVDCGLSVVSYQCLTLWENHYSSTDPLAIRQLAALAEVDVYVYDQTAKRLAHRLLQQCDETMSPALLEMSYANFLDGTIDLR